MTSTNTKNLIELRQLLAEKFPGVRMEAGRQQTLAERWPTGVPQVDFHLEGGLAKSALTEVISAGTATGSALLLSQVVRRAQANGQWSALVDSVDSFDPASLNNDELSRLIWVRASSAKEAVKAADLLLHDGTVPVVMIDFVFCPRGQLRRIPSSTWHRFSRAIERSSAVCLILTPEPMISTAVARLRLQPRFSLDSVEADRDTLLAGITALPAGERIHTRRSKAFRATA